MNYDENTVIGPNLTVVEVENITKQKAIELRENARYVFVLLSSGIWFGFKKWSV